MTYDNLYKKYFKIKWLENYFKLILDFKVNFHLFVTINYFVIYLKSGSNPNKPASLLVCFFDQVIRVLMSKFFYVLNIRAMYPHFS